MILKIANPYMITVTEYDDLNGRSIVVDNFPSHVINIDYSFEEEGYRVRTFLSMYPFSITLKESWNHKNTKGVSFERKDSVKDRSNFKIYAIVVQTEFDSRKNENLLLQYPQEFVKERKVNWKNQYKHGYDCLLYAEEPFTVTIKKIDSSVDDCYFIEVS